MVQNKEPWTGRAPLTVGTDTKVDLLGERILFESFRDTEDGIRRSFFDIGPC